MAMHLARQTPRGDAATAKANASATTFVRIHWIVWAGITVASAFIIYHFHDQSWWAPDDGAYAYVAWRLVEGDVLVRDVADVHPGYINFINAGAMRIFGVDMVAMRYPLALLTIIQVSLTYWLLSSRGVVVASVGASAAAALTFILFVNPTANWYALFLALCAAAVLSLQRLPLSAAAPLLGFILGNAFLFRQLSAVFLAMGVLCWLAIRYRPATALDRAMVRSVITLISVGLAGYLISKGSIVGLVLFGIWPFLLLQKAWTRTSVLVGHRDAQALTFSILGRITAGAGAAIVPLLIYHATHGTIGGWLHDSLVAPFLLTGFGFFQHASFGRLVLRLISLSADADAIGLLNLAFWLALLLAPIILGARLAFKLWSGALNAATPLAVVAVFFGLVSIHYEIPIYLNYTSFLTISGLLSMELPRRELYLWAGSAGALCGVALLFQAGQPASRGLDAILVGRTVMMDASAHPRASIRIAESERSNLDKVLVAIDQHAQGEGAVLAAPFNPEFYFLTQRQSPFRHGITALELQGTSALSRSIEQFEHAPPTLLIHRRQDKYNTPEVLALVEELARWSGHRESVGEYDLYSSLDPRRVNGRRR